MAGYERSRKEIKQKLDSVIGRSLKEVDVNNAFAKTIGHPKVTGIAGDVIEKSVLDYPSNSDQEADLLVDGVHTEVKTTGIRYSNKSMKGRPKPEDFEAKEPMSITAVSPEKIVNETFLNSNLWEKLNHTLIVYYHYASKTPVLAEEYKGFVIKGYEFHDFSSEDREALESDWKKVRDYIADAQANYADELNERYSQLGSALRKELTMLDTAPKWPHRPRFRLKRAAVSTIVHEYFSSEKYQQLAPGVNTIDSLAQRLHNYTERYKGWTVHQLLEEFDISYAPRIGGTVPKSVAEKIVLKMFHSDATSLGKVKIFKKSGIIPKTITLKENSGHHTEDVKLFPIDFDELVANRLFETSDFYNYFDESKFLFICFTEHKQKDGRRKNTFEGFKLVIPSEEVIEKAKIAWEDTRSLIINKDLKEEVRHYAKTGEIIYNKKTKLPQTVLNFMKSKQNTIFLRGTGTDSTRKPEQVNGISMYKQYLWIRGKEVANLLKQESFL
ncbi:MutH/Sau3AI family endonuclease [Lactiplantibacillus plantarum]|uniref:MutH/Sau3AI family endonuclease n=1 Tax=Lactiplantibacillus plantarum TaxID=1590 RepID=UPI00325DC0B0